MERSLGIVYLVIVRYELIVGMKNINIAQVSAMRNLTFLNRLCVIGLLVSLGLS